MDKAERLIRTMGAAKSTALTFETTAELVEIRKVASELEDRIDALWIATKDNEPLHDSLTAMMDSAYTLVELADSALGVSDPGPEDESELSAAASPQGWPEVGPLAV